MTNRWWNIIGFAAGAGLVLGMAVGLFLLLADSRVDNSPVQQQLIIKGPITKPCEKIPPSLRCNTPINT